MIIVLCGKSCVGKDSLREWACTENNWERVVSYTSRPMRSGEMNGREYLV